VKALRDFMVRKGENSSLKLEKMMEEGLPWSLAKGKQKEEDDLINVILSLIL